MTSRQQPPEISQIKRQNYIIIWIDANIKFDNPDTNNTKAQLDKVVNEVQLLTEPNECIKMLNNFVGTRSFVITSGSCGQTLLPRIHSIRNLEAVFIFCGNKDYHEGWSKEWSKIKRVETEINPICQELSQLVTQVKNDEIAISFIPTDSDGSTTELKQLEPSFMYTGLLKDTLLTMSFTSEHIDKMVKSFLNKYQTDHKERQNLNEFIATYESNKAIWWYTRESFVYNDLNRSLRELEGDIIIDMGFFIHDLHEQIEKLHRKQLRSFGKEKFILYRGQGLSIEEFEKFKKSKDGLLGFNCFLSTSTNKLSSFAFTKTGSQRSGCVGILFIMIIDPSLRMIPFARIQGESAYQAENEILFAMHTIFKIGEIKKQSDCNNIFQVSLELTSEDDPRLKQLKKYMAGQHGVTPEHRLGRILLDMGQHRKAEEIYLDLLKKTIDERQRGLYNHQLGVIKGYQEKYEEALEYYEKTMAINKRILPENDLKIATTYNSYGFVYKNMGQYSKALTNYRRSLEIYKKTFQQDHPDIATSYNNIGAVYYNMAEYSKALVNYNQSLEIRKKTLPKDHPDFAQSYLNIGTVYYSEKQYEKALKYFEEAHRIQMKSLPQTHPDVMTVNNWINEVKEL